MVLSGKATRTQEAYIGSVVSLARYYKLSPEQLSVEEVRHYLLHRLRERHLARSSVYQYGCAYRFLYGTVDLAHRHAACVHRDDLVSNPVKRHSCLPMSRGSKLDKVSSGSQIAVLGTPMAIA